MARRVSRARDEFERLRPWLTAAPTSLDHRVPLRPAPPARPVPEPVEELKAKRPAPAQPTIPLTMTKNDPAREFYKDVPVRGQGQSWSDFAGPVGKPVAPQSDWEPSYQAEPAGVQSPIPLGGQDFQWSDMIPEDRVYRALVDKYNAATDDQKRWGSQWYDAAGEYIRNLAQATGRTESQVAAVMAAFSPQTAWDPNMQQATYFLLNHDPDDPGSMARMRDAMPSIGANLDRAGRIMAADGHDDAAIEEALGGGNDTPKIKNFWRGMLGDRDAMTIDTWMVRAMLGDHLDLGDSAAAQDVLNWAGSYDKLSEVARRAAKDLGVDPRALQAIVWSQVNPSADYSPLSPDAWRALDDERTKRWTKSPMKKPMPDYTHGPGWRALPAPALSAAPGYSPGRAAAAGGQPIYRGLRVPGRRRAAAPVKLYRGVRVNLPDDLVAEMREKLADPTTAAEFGRELDLGPKILDHLATQPWEATLGGALHDWTGLGPHWHTDPRFAHTAAYGDLDERQQGHGKRDWPLLMTAEWDGTGQVEAGWGDRLEHETQLGRGTPLRITSLLLQPELVPGGGVKGRELLWRPDWQRLTESHGISTGGPRQYTAGRRVSFRLGWYEKDESLPGNWAFARDDKTGETLAELCWDGDTGEVNWIETYKGHRRRGIARDLFHWVRNNHQPDLHHSDDLSEDGEAFARAVASIRAARRLLWGAGAERTP